MLPVAAAPAKAPVSLKAAPAAARLPAVSNRTIKKTSAMLARGPQVRLRSLRALSVWQPHFAFPGHQPVVSQQRASDPPPRTSGGVFLLPADCAGQHWLAMLNLAEAMPLTPVAAVSPAGVAADQQQVRLPSWPLPLPAVAAPCVCAARGSRAFCPHLPSRTSRLSCCELLSLRWPAWAVLRSGGAGFTHLIHKRGVVDGGPRVQPGALTGLCACAQVLRDAVLPAAPVRRGHRQAGARPRSSAQRVAVAGRRRFVCRAPRGTEPDRHVQPR